MHSKCEELLWMPMNQWRPLDGEQSLVSPTNQVGESKLCSPSNGRNHYNHSDRQNEWQLYAFSSVAIYIWSSPSITITTICSHTVHTTRCSVFLHTSPTHSNPCKVNTYPVTIYTNIVAPYIVLHHITLWPILFICCHFFHLNVQQ